MGDKKKHWLWALICRILGKLVDHWIPFVAAALFGLPAIAFYRKLPMWAVIPLTLPLWAVCLLSLFALPVVLLVMLVAVQRKPEPVEQKDPWQEYVHDTFFGFNWYWRYLEGRLCDVRIICPDPDCMGRAEVQCSVGGMAELCCKECGKSETMAGVPSGTAGDWLVGKVAQNIRLKGLAPESFVLH